MALNARQLKFARLVAGGMPASQAYRKAGYKTMTPHSAESSACKLLRNAEVAAIVSAATAKAAAEVEMTAAEVIRGLSRIARFDRRKLYRADDTFRPPSEWDDDTAAVVTGVEVEETVTPGEADEERDPQPNRVSKVKTADQLKAWELLGRHFGLWKDGAHTTTNNVTINTTQVNLAALSDADLDQLEAILARAGREPAALAGGGAGGEGPAAPPAVRPPHRPG
jgi:phage terminase small subunit